MSLEEAIAMLKTLEQKIETGMILISEEIAMNAMGMIVNRIQQQGIEGRSYSDKKLPIYFFENKALNGGGRALIESHKKKKERTEAAERGEKVRKNKKLDELEDGISYEEWRQANGLQTAHVDLTFSGRMFQNVGVVGTVRVGDQFVTIIGGTDKEVRDKLRWNAQRFGDYFMVTPEEKEHLKDLFKKRMKELLNSSGL